MKKRSTLLRGRLMLLSVVFFSFFHSNAQNVAKRLDPANQDTIPFLEYVPAGHNTAPSTKKYPLIIFLHGADKKSDNPSIAAGAPVWNLQGYGPSKLVSQGHKMNFLWNGIEDSFMVISPMCRATVRTGTYAGNPVGYYPTNYVTRIINYATSNLKVDLNRIYLTGYSFGGGGTWIHIADNANNAKALAAAVPIAPASNHHDLWGAKPNGPQYVSDAKLPVWAFHAEDDELNPPSATTIPVNNINSYVPSPVKALATIWPTGLVPSNRHTNSCPWVYDINLFPYGSEGIVNIYEWFLGQNKSLPANVLPVANAGSDFSVSGTTATLNGSASNDPDSGGVIRYVWKAIAAPTGVSLSSISIATPLGASPSTTASNLTTPGNYTFRLFAVDTRAGYSTDDVVVTVSALGDDKGMTFGANGRIQTTDVTPLNGASAFTLEAHFKYDATLSGWTTIMRKMTSLTNRIMLHKRPSVNSIAVMIGNGADSRGYTPDNSLVPGNWYHVAAVYDGTQAHDTNRLKIYLNGVKQTLTFPNGSIPASTSSTNTAPFMAGGEPSCCNLNGTLDEVRVWSAALSSATINTWKDKHLGTCHPNASNLVVYWPLDDNTTAGTVAAGLSTTYTGTIFNGTYVNSTRATAGSGCSLTPPNAVSFSSSNGKIDAGNVSQLSGASKFTLEAQFKYDATVSTYTTIFRKSSSTSNRIMMHIGPSNNSIHLVVGNGYNSYGVTGANVVSPGTWYHAAVVYDGTLSGNANRLKLYINGVQQTLSFSAFPADIPATTGTNTAPFMAGGEGSCCYLNGTLDEVRVWSTALSSTTINDWKDQLLGNCHPNFANLVVYWPLDDDATAGTATAGLSTSYTGTITSGSYVTSTQVTASSGCGSPAILGTYTEPVNKTPAGGALYPNPTTDAVKINFTATGSKVVTVRVIDIYGRYVLRQQRSVMSGNNTISLSVSSLARGNYFIEVNDGKTILGKYKVIKR